VTESPDHVERNRHWWNERADDYQSRHGEAIARPAWGVWQIPEDELQVLGDVSGKDVLEFGCGGGQWSVGLARQGARAVGLDLSDKQLEHARRLAEESGVDAEFLQASAEDVPLPDAAFDVVFCDHGAFGFANPRKTVPEAARLLRPGGLLAFSHLTPIAEITFDQKEETMVPRLVEDYFGLHKTEDDDGSVVFNATYGEWVQLFVSNGLQIEELREIQAPEGGTNTYDWPYDWCRRWPGEQIWKLRKR
jgi:2-polyprenyl-3-methyl-5-hydroxy-6-metoxy-1,4-benzoquinol methylase